ncbi:chemotaxis protein [Psychroflexus salis]|uniref:Four helix bundle sensory module for signal transduction n=1 Tax=Psychroflexus salis TaxID=1526574 RepID=A0A916ZQK6_9FLAO|nr:chemotaxis protein [Psychroflexus salis]GGE07876.1 hypothetical protein GCM10010831_06790 [Psychroflexus salis]
MAFYDKLKWILGILMIFILIITTNLIDKNNFLSVRDSVITIYEDRLIADDMVFEMLKNIHKKELAMTSKDSIYFKNENLKVNENLDELISKFEKTKLTTEEVIIFNDLKQNLQSLITIEEKHSIFDRNKSTVLHYLQSIKANLNNLSKIQLIEGSRQMSISKRAIDTIELYTQIEIYVLVFLAIIIQIIVMYKPKNKS